MRILVTGVCGMIGSYFTERLLKEGHEVIGFDNLSFGSMDNIKSFIDDENFDFEAAKHIASEFYERHLINPYAKDGVDLRTGKTNGNGLGGVVGERQRQQMQNIKNAFLGDEVKSFSLNKDTRFELNPKKGTITEITADGKQQISAQKMLDLMFKTPGLYDAAKIFKGINFADVPDIDDMNPVIYTKKNKKAVRYNDFEYRAGKWYYPGGKQVNKKDILTKLNSYYF